MPYHFEFDYKHFEETLIEDTSECFGKLHQQHTNEQIFAFGLHSHIEFEIMIPFIITGKNSNWKRCTEPYWHMVRIPPMDWDLYDSLGRLEAIRSKGMKGIDTLIRTARYEGVQEDKILEIQQPHLDEYRETCIQGMRRMDANRVFGKGAERDGIILMLAFDYVDPKKARILVNPTTSK